MKYLHKFLSKIPYDERTHFRDLSNIPKKLRKPKSKVLNFYSSSNNIGNFTPVLGIQKLTGEVFDVWCIHDKKIDWNFINFHYDKVIIGGAGLIHVCFEHFWKEFIRCCKLPSVIWGVGGIFPKNIALASNVENKILNEAFHKCDLINLRDELTANYVGVSNFHLSACPTIAYLEDFSKYEKNKTQILYSSHEELLSKDEKAEVKKFLHNFSGVSFTSNIQYNYKGLKRILKQYLNSRAVITTRLHGAIIAYGLGIPYIAISFDRKVEEFHRLYGNGYIFHSLSELDKKDFNSLLENSKVQKPDMSEVKKFAELVKKDWL